MAKKTLEQHDDLVLHALGNATTISVIAAENLVKNGYADYVKMETKTIEVEESRRNRDRRGGAPEEEKKDMEERKRMMTYKEAYRYFVEKSDIEEEL